MQSMRSRRPSVCAALAALAAMLFAQAAIALALCDIGLSGATPMHSGHETLAMPCHEPEQSTNLCVAHCRNSDQTLDKPQVKVLAAAPAPAAHLCVVFAPADRTSPVTRTTPLPAGPPPRILFHSFLI